MKKKFALRLFTALLFPVIIASCGKEEEQETVQPAADLVIDNSAVTLLQGDEITVSITSGNGDYSVKTFDESVATATIDGDKVTIKATENSVLDENNRAETTILVIDGRKKTARIKVQVAKLWDLTTDIPEEASANENLLGYWIPGNGIKTGTFKNYGSAGTDLDAKVYTQGANISETTVNADKFASTACPHTY